MSEKTEAIVLRTVKFSESSQIVTFYSKKFGKFAGIVKGARRPTSRVAAALQPMSHVSLIVYRKEGREVQTVAQCDLMRHFRILGEDLGRMAYGMKCIELLQLVTHEGDENEPLFSLAAKTLALIDQAGTDPAATFCRFEILMAGHLGFALQFESCVRCGGNIDSGERCRFDLDRGGPLCPRCTSAQGNGIEVGSDALRMLGRIAAAGGQEDADRSRALSGELQSLLWTYFRHHIPGIRSLRTEAVFSSILNES